MLIVCTKCQSNIHVPQTAAGKKGKCPRCGTVLTVPPATPPAVAPPPAPEPPPVPPPVPATAYASEIPPPLPAPEPPPVPRAPRGYDADDEPRRRRYNDDDDDDDLSIRRPRRRSTSKAMAISAMCLGVSGLLLSAAGVLVIIGGASLGQSMPTRTGMRCTTLTQFPVAFCGGMRANTAPLAGLMVATRPLNVMSG